MKKVLTGIVCALSCFIILSSCSIDLDHAHEDPVSDRINNAGTHWSIIPTSKNYTLYVNDINGEVISMVSTGSTESHAIATVNMHYKNYQLYYSKEKVSFYYYDESGNPHSLSKEDVEYIPSKFFK